MLDESLNQEILIAILLCKMAYNTHGNGFDRNDLSRKIGFSCKLLALVGLLKGH